MQKNIGKTDRWIRFILGGLVLFYAWWQASWVALAFALFIFYEVVASWCIFYQLIGKNTCPLNQENRKK